MTDINTLQTFITTQYPKFNLVTHVTHQQLTIDVPPEHLKSLCYAVRDDKTLACEQLMDIAGADFLYYGMAEWETTQATTTGFERGVDREKLRVVPWDKPRFGLIYQLLSVSLNHRIRVRTFIEGDPLMVDSLVDVWSSANWNEREAYDLYGIIFKGHPDLRRILTDYGFIGHPFRKDFPLIGDVEMRYDAKQARVIYEPVSIKQRTLVPKVIREETHV